MINTFTSNKKLAIRENNTNNLKLIHLFLWNSISQWCVKFRCLTLFFFNFLKDFIYLFPERGGRKKGRETSVCGCLSRAPNWGAGLQPRHMPWLGIEPVTLWFAGQRSVHWATPARAQIHNFNLCKFILKY